MIYVLKIYYNQKRIEFTSQDSAKDIDVASWRSSKHPPWLKQRAPKWTWKKLIGCRQPHRIWQIGSRLKSCAVTVAPPPWCIGGVWNSHLRSMRRLCALLGRRVASRREILSPMKKYMPSTKERSFLTVRMREKLLPSSWRWRRVVATDLRSHHLLLDPSLGTPTCRLCASGVRCCSKGMVCNARTPPQCLQEGTW
jgi:hypothetical protein